MNFCDHCLSRYHTKCEEVSKQEIDLLESLTCRNCDAWSSKYKQVFTPVLDASQSREIVVPSSLRNSGKYFSSWLSWKHSIYLTKAT